MVPWAPGRRSPRRGGRRRPGSTARHGGTRTGRRTRGAPPPPRRRSRRAICSRARSRTQCAGAGRQCGHDGDHAHRNGIVGWVGWVTGGAAVGGGGYARNMVAVSLGMPTLPASRVEVGAAVRPSDDRLIDQHGRVATDLRVSVTDRCNLRCTYCMPAEGLPWLPGEAMLSDEELVRLIRVTVQRLGVDEVRFTGGEPLLRPGLVEIVRATAALVPRPHTSLTTNGLRLDRVNVSLDTLDGDQFLRLTRRDRLDDVLIGLRAAGDAGLTPVKLNTVLMRGVNDHEAVALLEFALEHGYELRFIEQMPLDAQHGWDRATMVTAEEILAQLTSRFTLTPDPSVRGGAPAETWLIDGGPARVGVI